MGAMEKGELVGGGIAAIMSNLADEPRLVDNYGPGEWVKMEHVHKLPPEVGPNGKLVEPQIHIHWFRNKTTGQNVELKFKIRTHIPA